MLVVSIHCDKNWCGRQVVYLFQRVDMHYEESNYFPLYAMCSISIDINHILKMPLPHFNQLNIIFPIMEANITLNSMCQGEVCIFFQFCEWDSVCKSLKIGEGISEKSLSHVYFIWYISHLICKWCGSIVKWTHVHGLKGWFVDFIPINTFIVLSCDQNWPIRIQHCKSINTVT